MDTVTVYRVVRHRSGNVARHPVIGLPAFASEAEAHIAAAQEYAANPQYSLDIEKVTTQRKIVDTFKAVEG
jgi:hypothetical protein